MTKYRAKPTEIDGVRFASKREAKRYQELRLLERAGEIRQLELQPAYRLTVNGENCGVYKADFSYFTDDKRVIEDVKGVRTPVYKLKKKLVKAIYGVEVLET